jgi:LmbE family N-acetylglucosaminyl deacetylase
MEWIFLSPHFDDIALSCGGIVWESTLAGSKVSVWTICAGDPPEGELSDFAQELHARWQTGSQSTKQRQAEDAESCRIMGTDRRFFSIPDAVYRFNPSTGEHFYATPSSIFGELHPEEEQLITTLSKDIEQSQPENCQWVCPFALGGHVDHQLTRRAVEQMATEKQNRDVWYYADYPYVLSNQDFFEDLKRAGWLYQRYDISEAGLQAWEEAIAAHASQISTFWQDRKSLHAAIRQYAAIPFGACLWKKA